MRALLFLAPLLFSSVAHAQSAPAPDDDGYCDYVKGVASATSVVSMSPTFLGMFGYVDQSIASATVNPSSTLRVIGGAKYSISGLYTGIATKLHAEADCRHGLAHQVVSYCCVLPTSALPTSAPIIATIPAPSAITAMPT